MIINIITDISIAYTKRMSAAQQLRIAVQRYEAAAGRAAAATLLASLAELVRSTADRQHVERLISRLYPDVCQDSP